MGFSVRVDRMQQGGMPVAAGACALQPLHDSMDRIFAADH
jgi:hypothetical protein